MNLKAIFLGTTALTVLAAPATAVADDMDWDAFYAGLGIVRLIEGGGNLLNATPVTAEGFVGYNHVSGQLLLGGEASVMAANFQDFGNPDTAYQGIVDLKGKVGYAGDGWTAYALGGVSGAVFDDDGLIATLTGYNFGAGATVMVTDNMFVGVEFVQRQFGEIITGKKAGKLAPETTQPRTISGKIGFVFN